MQKFYFLFLVHFVSLTCAGQTERLFRTYTTSSYTVEQTLLGLQDLSIHRTVNGLLNRYEQPEAWEEVTIPIVFHVLYLDEDARVTDQQITEQIAALNRDFSGESRPPEGDRRDPEGKFADLQSDTKIRFCIPERGLIDILLSFINFRQIGSVITDDLNLIKTEGFGLTPLDTRKYLNVWVAPLPDGNSGFAQIPGGNQETDGIVIDPRYFGSSGTAVAPYDQGKTLTHLVGTYLGLTPIWGDGTSCGDDGIADTPVHNGPNFGRPGKGHVSSCTGNPLEMTMNFMDACDDAQLYLFTQGQAAYMRAVLSESGPRGGLLNTATRCSDNKLLAAPTKSTPASDPQRPLTVRSYPNPANTIFNLRMSGGDDGAFIETVTVYSLKGRIVSEQQLAAGTTSVTIDGTDWPRGVYLIKTVVSGEEPKVHRLTLQ